MRVKPLNGERFPSTGDLCIGFWQCHWNRGDVTFPHGARVLEIGCAEGNWLTPMQAIRPDLDLVGLDVRAVDRPGALVGDVLTHDFPADHFDAIVAVSAIEHVGLGHYGDPVDADGDTHALQRAVTWLKPGGWIYLDVPYRAPGGYTVTRNYRAYDADALNRRLLVPGVSLRWAVEHPSTHPDGPFIAMRLDKEPA